MVLTAHGTLRAHGDEVARVEGAAPEEHRLAVEACGAFIGPQRVGFFLMPPFVPLLLVVYWVYLVLIWYIWLRSGFLWLDFESCTLTLLILFHSHMRRMDARLACMVAIYVGSYVEFTDDGRQENQVIHDIN